MYMLIHLQMLPAGFMPFFISMSSRPANPNPASNAQGSAATSKQPKGQLGMRLCLLACAHAAACNNKPLNCSGDNGSMMRKHASPRRQIFRVCILHDASMSTSDATGSTMSCSLPLPPTTPHTNFPAPSCLLRCSQLFLLPQCHCNDSEQRQAERTYENLEIRKRPRQKL